MESTAVLNFLTTERKITLNSLPSKSPTAVLNPISEFLKSLGSFTGRPSNASNCATGISAAAAIS